MTSNGWNILDDTDPRISYQGDWRKGGIKGEYQKTTHGAVNASGSSVSLNFSGTQIGINATLDPRNSNDSNPIFQVFLDGNLEVSYEPNLTSYKQLVRIFESRVLDDGEHTLLIINQVRTAKTIWLDSFSILPSDSTASTRFLSPSSTSTHLPVNTSSDTFSPKQSMSLSIGGIVGVALGVIGLILMFTLVFLWRKRTKKQTRRLKAEVIQPSTTYPYRFTTSSDIHDSPCSTDSELSSTMKSVETY
ncbi:hypothetical protein K435DRAFT_844292 [Dendrothele bispora CBS 962.96]|uniref:Uncharacterized protein n=1 Tax=Dendrothele bispora (strain CBS 962.96) TaxID=1314807 RepID=A0A4V4HCB7_DENBC|nr:hypothetical protein K435DRAFT_844292 [Dendrothele bispora CBS 962.96]